MSKLTAENSKIFAEIFYDAGKGKMYISYCFQIELRSATSKNSEKSNDSDLVKHLNGDIDGDIWP